MDRRKLGKKCSHEKVVLTVEGEIVCSKCGLLLSQASMEIIRIGVKYPPTSYPSENSTRLHIALMKREI